MSAGRIFRWLGIGVLVCILLSGLLVAVALILGPIPDSFESPQDAIAAVADGHQGTTYREIDAQDYLIVQPATVVPVIEAAILHSDSREARQALVGVLGAHPSEEASAALRGFLESEDAELRGLSSRALEDRASTGVYQP